MRRRALFVFLALFLIALVVSALFFALRLSRRPLPKPSSTATTSAPVHATTTQATTSSPTAPQATGVTCHSTARYFVAIQAHTDSVGSDILVRAKPTPQTSYPCRFSPQSGDFVLQGGGAVYYLGFVGQYLVTDEGTAPPPRTLTIYDVPSRSAVYTTSYAGPVSFATSSLTFWKALVTKPTTATCPQLGTLKSEGLGAVLEASTTLALPGFAEHTHGTRCAATQA